MTLRRLVHCLTLMILLAAFAAPQAQARNVPGSAAASGTTVGEEVSDLILQQIGQATNINQSRIQIQGGGPGFLAGDGTQSVTGFTGVIAGETLSFTGSLGYRRIDTDDLDYGFTAGTALVMGRIGPDTVLYGGLLVERGQGDTLTNDGTLEHDGMGLAIGVTHAIGANTFLQATLGQSWLDYDFTRSGGAVSGSYDAQRTFLDLSGSHRIVAGNTTTDLSGGLRYFHQTNDAHVETGGGAVAETSAENFSVVFGARTSFALEAGVDPFVELDLRQSLSSSENFPAELRDLAGSDTHGRLGLGFTTGNGSYSLETGIGSNFDDEGYSGLDAHLRLNLQF